jgi:hypothetical protein
MDTLEPGLRVTHQMLVERLDLAAAARPTTDPAHPRDQYPAIDTFLASASRHNAAMLAVIVPAVRSHLPHGPERAHDHITQSRRFEVALSQVKAKLYGSTYAVRRSWESIWDDVRRELAETCRLERALVADLVAARRDGDPDWGERLYRAELSAPTRPHPYIPHQGLPGRVARTLARRVDGFWDAAEGRMVPEPLHHHERRDDGRFTQYLLADPHLPEDDDADDDAHRAGDADDERHRAGEEPRDRKG